LRAEREIANEIEKLACLVSYCTGLQLLDDLERQPEWTIRRERFQSKLDALMWVMGSSTLYFGNDHFEYFSELERDLNN